MHVELSRSGPAVLLLEPDKQLQRLVKTILRRDGFSVIAATDGDGAVSAFRKRTFDVVIVDVSIWASVLETGARRGVGFLHFLQRTDSSVLDRVILTSALAERDLPNDLPAVHRLIRKPFDVDDLRHAVAECHSRAILTLTND